MRPADSCGSRWAARRSRMEKRSMNKRWWCLAGLLMILPAVWLYADEAKPEAMVRWTLGS